MTRILAYLGVFISLLSSPAFSGERQLNMGGKMVLSTQNELLSLDLRSADGKKPQAQARVIIASNDEYRHPSWFPEGKQIVFSYLSWEEGRPTVRSSRTFYSLAKISDDGSGFVYLLKGDENCDFPSVSPDGNMIAFVAYPNWPNERVGRLRILNISTKMITKINTMAVDVATLSWSSDGKSPGLQLPWTPECMI
jgi:Tol biopolymer transport system component